MAISSIFVKESIGLSSRIRKVNDELRVLWSINKFYFISNDSITRKYLCGDGVYLTEVGINILAGNIVNYLNEVVLGVNMNKLDWHGKVCSEERYGTENVSDQNHDFNLTSSNQVDINDLVKMREVYSKNRILGYLNINSLSNKIVSLKDVVAKVPIDILCIDETKLDDSYPDSQFLIEHYQFPP